MALVIVSLVVFLFLSAFYSGVETGLISLEVNKIKQKSRNNHIAKEILNIINSPSKVLGITLLGTNISNVMISTIATVYFVEKLHLISGNYLSLLLSFVVLLFGELLPKSLYRDFPQSMVFLTFPLFRISSVIFKPFVWFISLYYKILGNLFKIDDTDEMITREDLTYFLSRTKNENKLQKFQMRMLEEALEFTELKAKNVMIPRTDMVAITKDMSYDGIMNLAVEKGYTRFPVYDGDIDNIIGLLIIYDLLKYNSSREFNLDNYLRTPLICHETMNIDAVLRDMQSKRKSIAIIIDSYGGTAGLITVEDILEEIVGEIEDEYDNDLSESDVNKIGQNSYIVRGFIEIDELNSDYDFNLPEGDYETVSGLIINKLAKIPAEGAKLQVGNWNIQVLESTSKKIRKVKFVKVKN